MADTGVHQVEWLLGLGVAAVLIGFAVLVIVGFLRKGRHQ